MTPIPLNLLKISIHFIYYYLPYLKVAGLKVQNSLKTSFRALLFSFLSIIIFSSV